MEDYGKSIIYFCSQFIYSFNIYSLGSYLYARGNVGDNRDTVMTNFSFHEAHILEEEKE